MTLIPTCECRHRRAPAGSCQPSQGLGINLKPSFYTFWKNAISSQLATFLSGRWQSLERQREREVQKYKWSKETWPPWCPNIHWTWTQRHWGCPHSLSHTPVPHLSHPELILFFLTSLQSPAFFLGSVRQGEHWAEGVQGRIPSLPGKAAFSGFPSENPVSAKFCTFTNRKSLKTPTQLCPYSKSDLKGSGW